MRGNEGEVRVFKNGNAAEAYCWKDGRWEKIGDVVNPTTGIQGALHYEGDRLFQAGEYDHVFDVDLGDGLMRKLPFDNGANPGLASDKFLVREGLGRAYSEQITSFIKNNSIPYVTSDNEFKKTGILPGGLQQNVAPKSTVLPMKKLLFFDAINVDAPKKKLLEFNSEL